MGQAGFSQNCKSSLAFFSENMHRYVLYMCLYASLIALVNWVFEQENAAVNFAKSTKESHEFQRVNIMKWPACSRDLNPIDKCQFEIARGGCWYYN